MHIQTAGSGCCLNSWCREMAYKTVQCT